MVLFSAKNPGPAFLEIAGPAAANALRPRWPATRENLNVAVATRNFARLRDGDERQVPAFCPAAHEALTARTSLP